MYLGEIYFDSITLKSLEGLDSNESGMDNLMTGFNSLNPQTTSNINASEAAEPVINPSLWWADDEFIMEGNFKKKLYIREKKLDPTNYNQQYSNETNYGTGGHYSNASFPSGIIYILVGSPEYNLDFRRFFFITIC